MKPVLLVHGAWHGSWCWRPVMSGLSGLGILATTLDLPLTGLADDTRTVSQTLDVLGGEAILVGHSYGGSVISGAADGRDDIDHLVYLCALLVANDESPADMVVEYPAVALNDALVISEDGTSHIDPALAPAAFYGDADPDAARAAAEQLRPMEATSVLTTPGAEPWRHIPTTYVVCSRDEAIAPGLQRHMARNATTVHEWDCDHSPFLSRPQLVVDLLAELAAD